MQKDKWFLVSLFHSHALTVLANTASKAENFLSLGHFVDENLKEKRNNINLLELICIYIVEASGR